MTEQNQEYVLLDEDIQPLYWGVRFPGQNFDMVDLLTGERVYSIHDLSGFVSSMKHAHDLVDMITKIIELETKPGVSIPRAKITWRMEGGEPYHIQVKVACGDAEVLERLCNAVSSADNILRPQSLLWAAFPDKYPGYKPKALRLLDDLKESCLDQALRAWRGARHEIDLLQELNRQTNVRGF